MRGTFEDQGGLFSYIAVEERVPAGHPWRKLRADVRAVLAAMDRTFSRMYATEGRPSIPPEQLFSALRASVVTRYQSRARCTGFGRRRGRTLSSWHIAWQCRATV